MKQLNRHKILVISNMYPSKKDYYGIFVKNFVENLLSDCRFSVSKVVIAGKTNSKIIKVIKYVKFYAQIFYSMVFKNFDLVYVHYISHSSPALRFSQIFRKNKICFNIHGDDLLPQSKLSICLLNIVKDMLVEAEMIVVPSYYFKNILLQIVPKITSTRIFVSPSGGVDTDKFTIKSKEKDSQNIFTVGYVSRINRGKGWQVFLNAIKILKNEENIRVLVAGSGNEETDFIKKIHEYGLDDLIEYQGGLKQEELVALYSEMDIFVFPTELRESLGLVGIEAMACGVPVIGSKIGGLTDYIVDGFNGFFFEPGNSNDLLTKIKTYTKLTYIEKEQMKMHARETAENYNMYTVSEKLHNKLITILKKNNPISNLT
jgi:glycosyltransferase involved in cell wall biosynthesis